MASGVILFQGTKQNPLSSEDLPHRIVIIIIVQFGAMVGKVAITQSQVRGTQQDSNTSALADDVTTFLLMMTKR